MGDIMKLIISSTTPFEPHISCPEQNLAVIPTINANVQVLGADPMVGWAVWMVQGKFAQQKRLKLEFAQVPNLVWVEVRFDPRSGCCCNPRPKG